jgi:DNA ligase-associated metallophosphoesterase
MWQVEKIGEKEIDFGGERLVLNTLRSIYWRSENILILSDVHLGKPAHFRKHGIQMPSAIAQFDLSKLEHLIKHYQPRTIVVVGDLIHVGHNTEVATFTNFRNSFAHIDLILVQGNHDRITEAQAQAIGITRMMSFLRIGNICFSHYMPETALMPTISGHVHPGVEICLPTKRYARFPCFLVSETQIVLPAFSAFTGLDVRTRIKGGIAFAICEEELIAL